MKEDTIWQKKKQPGPFNHEKDATDIIAACGIELEALRQIAFLYNDMRVHGESASECVEDFEKLARENEYFFRCLAFLAVREIAHVIMEANMLAFLDGDNTDQKEVN